MLIIGFKGIGKTAIASKYSDKIIEIDPSTFRQDSNWPVNYIENIKGAILNYEIVIIPYIEEVILCLDALNIEYTLVYPDETNKEKYLPFWNEFDIFNKSNKSKIILEKDETIEQALSQIYDWIIIEEDKNDLVKSKNNLVNIPENKNKLSLDQLLNEDLEITEADVRDLKATQNKLKVGMLLQAKNSLNRVLKLSNVLDRLYDKLIDRIDNSLDTTDTASLMYTTEYIAKALNETNQFIVSLISNEKIQNFFIIDNSSVINVNDDRIDINSREKIRKAVEIVMDNIDYFEQGQYENMKNPNLIEAEGEVKDANN